MRVTVHFSGASCANRECVGKPHDKPLKGTTMKKIIAIAALAAASASPAMAQSSSMAGFNGSVDFTGQVPVECTVTGLQDTILFGTLGRRGQAAAQVNAGVDVFCNQPSEVTFESENGYLALQTTNNANDSVSETNFESGANPGFDAGLDYTAEVVQFGIMGDSSQLTAGTPQSISPVPAINQNNLRLRYDTVNSGQPLLGGFYEDTLTITLTPQGV